MENDNRLYGAKVIRELRLRRAKNADKREPRKSGKDQDWQSAPREVMLDGGYGIWCDITDGGFSGYGNPIHYEARAS